MYNTPRKTQGNRAHDSPARVHLKGLFMDGTWHCNCTPRLPAAHFLVRKEGPNKGRWFYTCQEPKESSCGFFLWDEDAATRAMGAVINNSRSEPAAALERATVTRTVDKRTVEGHIEASNKWIAGLVKKEEEDFGDWPLSKNDEILLVDAAAEESMLMQPRNPKPETPRKAIRTDILGTPGSKRKRDEADALPTPKTGQDHPEDVFTVPSSTRIEGGMWDRNETPGLISPSITPTPARFHNDNKPWESTETMSDLKDYDITKELMGILLEQSLDEEITIQVRQLLNKHALKIQGIARGRDISRVALKTKERKIAELEQRIVELQNERELDKIIIKHFKSDMAQSLNSRNRGKGRPDE